MALPDVISDGMVLQQNQRAPIWGKADPGETVTVKFAGQSKTATAPANGNWLIKLDPIRANATPAAMVISGKNTIELKNILVGEVWLVAGQSNMERLLSETANGEAAGLIDSDLSNGIKNGYAIRYVVVGASTLGAPAKYEVAATPLQYGRTGLRSFLRDSNGGLHAADRQGSVGSETDPKVE